MPYETVNPFTAEVVKEFAQHSDEEVELAVAQATLVSTSGNEALCLSGLQF